MADPYRPLVPGDAVTKISRTAYNGMLDMLRWWKTNGPSSRPSGSMVDWDQSVFFCRNDSGADVDEYGVVGIAAPLILPSENEREFLSKTPLSGVEPTSDHLGKWGVFLGATPDGTIGRLCVSGVVPVQVYITATTDEYCDITAAHSGCYLSTGESGARIIWKEDGAAATDIVWAIVRIGIGDSVNLKPFELKDDCAPGDTDVAAWVLDDTLARDEEADTILVSDGILGDVRALGSDTATDGARGFYTVCADGNNHIVSCKRLAVHCRAVAKGAISGSTGTVDGVTVMDDGQSPVSESTTELSVNNPWNFYLADNALCELTRNAAAWDITNVALVAETFDTEQRVNALTLQHKYREIRVNPTGAEHDWDTWHTGDDCTA